MLNGKHSSGCCAPKADSGLALNSPLLDHTWLQAYVNPEPVQPTPAIRTAGIVRPPVGIVLLDIRLRPLHRQMYVDGLQW